MLPVSPSFHTVLAVRIGLKTHLEVANFKAPCECASFDSKLKNLNISNTTFFAKIQKKIQVSESQVDSVHQWGKFFLESDFNKFH